MSIFRAIIVSACTLLVALPVAPCALIAQGCPFEAPAVVAESAAPTSCCGLHATGNHDGQASGKSSSPAPSGPCTRDCCKVRAWPPVPEKVLADQPAVLPLMLGVGLTLAAAPVADLPAAWVAESPPLQILHCQWRL